MKNFYNKHILPIYLNLVMKNKSFEKDRIETVKNAKGIGLEIGFGSGLNLPFYQKIKKLYTIDNSVELNKITKDKIENVKFPIENIIGNAEELPFENNTFDFVVSTWSLCSINNSAKALQEIKRVLKPNGIFYFIEHGKNKNKFMQKIQSILTPFSKALAGNCHLNIDIESIIIAAGFSQNKIKTKKFKLLGLAYFGLAMK